MLTCTMSEHRTIQKLADSKIMKVWKFFKTYYCYSTPYNLVERINVNDVTLNNSKANEIVGNKLTGIIMVEVVNDKKLDISKGYWLATRQRDAIKTPRTKSLHAQC